jgi:IS30 family transposase
VIRLEGGISPRLRARSERALSFEERDLISRAVAAGESYRAIRADSRAWESARRPKACRLASRPRLRYLIATKLKQRWSPERISGWLRLAFPNEPELHVSHETIYRSLHVQTRSVLKQESLKHLRTSRFTILVKVESKEPGRVMPALIRQIGRLPTHVARSRTWDRGKELAHHQRFTVATGAQVYFCDPYRSWQRGTSENTNGLLRQYFRTGASLANVTQRQLDAVADQLNGRPRKTLHFRTPAEVFKEAVALIASIHPAPAPRAASISARTAALGGTRATRR